MSKQFHISIEDVAGLLPEKLAWMLLRDMGKALAGLLEPHGAVNPSHILWDETAFLLADSESAGEKDRRFLAPESTPAFSGDVWSLGASVFYLVMGTPVFNGLGGRAQRAESVLPYMRKGMPELSRLIMRCLSFTPEDRPSAQELSSAASQRLEALSIPSRPLKAKKTVNAQITSLGFWPETMTDAL